MQPCILIFSLNSALRLFRAVISDPEFPTIDVEAVVQVMFEAVVDLSTATDRIYITASRMCESDLLYEQGLKLSHACQQRLFYAAINLGQELKNTLVQLHAYRDHHLPFTFRTLINDTDVVLQSASAISPAELLA